MRWDAGTYQDKHAFVFKMGAGVVDLLDPRPGERILDVGCGAGQLTASIAERGAVTVGIDASGEMIAAARRNYPSLDWHVMNAADFEFAEPFDALFSNAALHWVHPPENAVRCMARALRSGGRFAVEFGGKGNIDAIVTALAAETKARGITIDNPWFYPSIAEYASMLERHELDVRQAMLFDRPTPLGEGESGMRNWLIQFRAPIVGHDPELLDAVVERLRPKLWDGEKWTADYVRIRLLAIKR